MQEPRPTERAGVPPTPPNPAPPPEKRPARPKENVKETIESILVAFILAFVFRAFVVEAFVIPSGSMAPTLLGAHMRYRCQECGYDFDVNFPNSDRDESMSIPSRIGPVPGRDRETLVPVAVSTHCPNCGYKVPRTTSDEYQSAVNSPVHYGDRILVLKYIYLLQEPHRWDVVVFKAPLLDRATHDYTTNYIKRLIGKPGESIMILDGDVYVGQTPQGPWTIQTKPRAAQEALWRIVYDNDFQPVNSELRPSKWKNPWQVKSGQGWAPGGAAGFGRVLSFNGASSNEAGILEFNKDANKGTFPLTDWLPYNETMLFSSYEDLKYEPDAYGANQGVPHWYVSDLKLQFFYQRTAGDGPLTATLSRLDDEFTAVFLPQSSPQKNVRLLHNGLPIGEASLPDSASPLQVEFSNVDYRVTIRVNGKDLIQTTPDQYAPNVTRLIELNRQRSKLAQAGTSNERIRAVFGPPRVSISAAGQNATLSHLSLWRDVYYTPGRDYGSGLEHGSPGSPATLHRRGDVVETVRDGVVEKHTCDNEYFVLGDNSILSLDARLWTADLTRLEATEGLWAESGRVPERFLLGKAFFVYWPAGYRPFSPRAPGVVPNFGDMRFVH